jgi:hypothetical protein
LEAIAHTFLDVRERKVLSKTDNLAALFWQRKGNATTKKATAPLLRAIVWISPKLSRNDYIPGKSNPIADDA